MYSLSRYNASDRSRGSQRFLPGCNRWQSNAELATVLEAAGIKLDHLWFDRDGPQLKLYYGAELLLDVPAEQLEKSMPRLIEQLQRRRLYV